MSIPTDLNTAQHCLMAVQLLLFVSMTIASGQNIYNNQLYSSRGLLAWKLLKYVYQEEVFKNRAWNVICSHAGVLTLNIMRLALIAAALASQPNPWAMTGLLIVSSLLYIRSYLQMSAADQLNTIIMIYLVVSSWFPSTRLVSLCGIAIQVIVCYLANGIAKLLEPAWLDGSALKMILQTETYSRKSIAGQASKLNPKVSKVLSRIVIYWELSAAVAPFLPMTWLIAYLTIGILFHLTIAFVMGLNTFFWSFISTYPAIFFLNRSVAEALR